LKAIGLSHLHVAQVAWFRNDVIEIIRQLKGTKIAILGGDVLQKRSDNFEHEYSSWHVDPLESESVEAYAERSLEETTAYIRGFPDPDDGSVAYVLVFEQVDCQPGARPDR
jgi:hypothetical protein